MGISEINKVQALSSEKVEQEQLIKALNDQDEYVRADALEELGKLSGSQMIDLVIKSLDDESIHVRCVAARVLGEYVKDKRAFERLVKALLSDQEKKVRWWAAYALGELKDERAVEPLTKALKDESWSVRKWVAVDLAKIGGELAKSALLTALNDENEYVIYATAGALATLGDVRAFEPLVKAFHHRIDDVRREAIQDLGILRDKRAFDMLIKALDGESKAVDEESNAGMRSTLVEALGNLNDKRVVEPIVNILLNDPAYVVRWSAADALANYDDKKAIEALIYGLEDSYNKVRQSSAIALGQLGDAHVLTILSKIQQTMTDEDVDNTEFKEAIDGAIECIKQRLAD